MQDVVFQMHRTRGLGGAAASFEDVADILGGGDLARLLANGMDARIERGLLAADRLEAECASSVGDLHQALVRLLAEQQTMFEALWQRFTLSQRAVLRAVVLQDGRELLSADVRERHRLGGASTVQTALAALLRDDVITRDGGRYAVVDSLLKEWVARMTF